MNRERVLRVMREQKLIQRRRSEPRRRRPDVFKVTRPAELWHMDMTAVWVVEHGWCYLNAAVDCLTREIAGGSRSAAARSRRSPSSTTRSQSRGSNPGC